MDTATTTNPHEELARERKCAAIVAVCIRHYGDASTAHVGMTAYAEDDVWEALERIAAVRPLSLTSRARVVEMLATMAGL